MILLIRILTFVDWLLGFYVFLLIFAAILSWLVAFQVVNTRNDLVRQVLYALEVLTEPLLRPIRRVIPALGGLDLSFLVLFFAIQFIRSVIIPSLIDALAS
ncbi:YggT family protein [Bradyrhizobium erythrophlei]|uniref:YggT family protein n=1 Tax=Bradyrhizobium erythrophlei TaxID=1437360 RepID=A0A1H4NZH2_9BRAD|nr:YggT family protein [Bradyrhizobium erythrophlei]SEC00600.1 YggT family protein [Bradyrhizobium erythrophlei]